MGKKYFIDFVDEIFVNTLGNIEGHLCNEEMNYNYDKKFYEKVALENERHLNCSVPFHPTTNSPITGRQIEICNNTKEGKKAIENWSVSFYSSSATPLDQPCSEIQFFFGLPLVNKYRFETEVYVKIYVKSNVKVKSVILYYDMTSLVADVGGYIGMLLGVSLVDLTIICNSAFAKAIKLLMERMYQQ